MNKTAPRAGRNNHRAKPNLSFRAQNYKKMMKSDTKTMFFVLFVAKNGKMIIPSTPPAMPPEAPPQPSPREGTEKVPFFYDQNGKCLRFVTSLSANRLK